MAGAVIADSGLRKVLQAALVERYFLRLFANDVPVLPGSLLTDYQAANFPGYVDADLTALWPVPAIDVTGRAWSAIYNVTWSRGPGGVPQTIYGWVMYQKPEPDAVLVCGRRLTVPRTLTTEGQTVIESVIVYLLRG